MAETYILQHPFTVSTRVQGGSAIDRQVDTVEIRRLNGGDMRWLEQNRVRPGATLELLQRLTGLQAVEVDRLDAEDIAEISEIVSGFLPPSLKAGKERPET